METIIQNTTESVEPTEFFLPIRNYPMYTLSNRGCVMNVKTGRMLRGTLRKDGYNNVKLVNHEGSSLAFLHRLIAVHFISNPESKPCVDHVDGIRNNNVITNLRWCTKSQNNFNKKVENVGTSSIFKGVCRYKGGKFQANITCEGKHYYLGHFTSEEDAARSYNKKAKELFKDFARLNDVPDV